MTNDYGNLELHTVLLSAMKDIDKICRENGLKYYLYAGTLLGALNYKGFIPWDDDIDIVMMPEDFYCFCKIINSKYRGIYELQIFDKDSNWYSKMNKMLIQGTEIISQHKKERHPFFIDICVLHSIPDQRWRRFFQRKKIEIINLILQTQSGEIIPTSLMTKLLLGNLSKVIKKEILGKHLDRIMSKYDNERTECLGIMCNTLTSNPYTKCNGYENDITKRSWHEEYQYVKFEDTEFMTISEAEQDLNRRYGLHWHDPYPEEKRVTKHDVKSYTISEEVRKRVGL